MKFLRDPKVRAEIAELGLSISQSKPVLEAPHKRTHGTRMTLAEIVNLLKSHQDPAEWRLVNDPDARETTAYYVEDVFLCIKFKVIWAQRKPWSRITISYSTTTITWFDLPIVSADNKVRTYEEVYSALKDSLN
jgi:hypothetical protein